MMTTELCGQPMMSPDWEPCMVGDKAGLYCDTNYSMYKQQEPYWMAQARYIALRAAMAGAQPPHGITGQAAQLGVPSQGHDGTPRTRESVSRVASQMVSQGQPHLPGGSLPCRQCSEMRTGPGKQPKTFQHHHVYPAPYTWKRSPPTNNTTSAGSPTTAPYYPAGSPTTAPYYPAGSPTTAAHYPAGSPTTAAHYPAPPGVVYNSCSFAVPPPEYFRVPCARDRTPKPNHLANHKSLAQRYVYIQPRPAQSDKPCFNNNYMCPQSSQENNRTPCSIPNNVLHRGMATGQYTPGSPYQAGGADHIAAMYPHLSQAILSYGPQVTSQVRAPDPRSHIVTGPGSHIVPGTGSHAAPSLGSHAAPGLRSHIAPGLGSHPAPGLGSHAAPGLGSHPKPGPGSHAAPGLGNQHNGLFPCNRSPVMHQVNQVMTSCEMTRQQPAHGPQIPKVMGSPSPVDHTTPPVRTHPSPLSHLGINRPVVPNSDSLGTAVQHSPDDSSHTNGSISAMKQRLQDIVAGVAASSPYKANTICDATSYVFQEQSNHSDRNSPILTKSEFRNTAETQAISPDLKPLRDEQTFQALQKDLDSKFRVYALQIPTAVEYWKRYYDTRMRHLRHALQQVVEDDGRAAELREEELHILRCTTQNLDLHLRHYIDTTLGPGHANIKQEKPEGTRRTRGNQLAPTILITDSNDLSDSDKESFWSITEKYLNDHSPTDNDDTPEIIL